MKPKTTDSQKKAKERDKRKAHRKRQSQKLIGWLLLGDPAHKIGVVEPSLNGGGYLYPTELQDTYRDIVKLGDRAAIDTLPAKDYQVTEISACLDLASAHAITDKQALEIADQIAEEGVRYQLELAANQYQKDLADGVGLDIAMAKHTHAVEQARAALPDRPDELLDKLISAKDLDAKVFEPVRYVIPGLLTEGATILAGPPKCKKSFLAMGLAAAVSCGGYALGNIRVEQGSVLFLGLEDPLRRLQDRHRKVMCGRPVPEAGIDFAGLGMWKTLDNGGLLSIERWLQTHPNARMVVVDTLAKVRHEKNRRDILYQDEYHAVEGLQALANTYRVAILIIHHTRKLEANDYLGSVSGTHGLTGCADGVMILTAKRNKQEGLLQVTGRDLVEDDQEIALKWDKRTTSWISVGDAAEHNLSEQRKAIRELFRHDPSPKSPNQAAPLLGMKLNNTKALFYKMSIADPPQLDALGDGKYTVLAFRSDRSDNPGNHDNSDTYDNPGNPDNPGSLFGTGNPLKTL